MKEQTYPVLVVRCTTEEHLDNTDSSFRSLVGIIKQRGRAGIVVVVAAAGRQTIFNARRLTEEILGKRRTIESWSNFDLRRSFVTRVVAACPKGELLVLVGDDKFVLPLLHSAGVSDSRKEPPNFTPYFLEVIVAKPRVGKPSYALRRRT